LVRRRCLLLSLLSTLFYKRASFSGIHGGIHRHMASLKANRVTEISQKCNPSVGRGELVFSLRLTYESEKDGIGWTRGGGNACGGNTRVIRATNGGGY
jgi:hypothetical protein